jgi:hypothetical protein
MTNVVNFRCVVALDQISVHLKVVAPSSNRHVMLFITTIERTSKGLGEVPRFKARDSSTLHNRK